jgi:hypothetical protein
MRLARYSKKSPEKSPEKGYFRSKIAVRPMKTGVCSYLFYSKRRHVVHDIGMKKPDR